MSLANDEGGVKRYRDEIDMWPSGILHNAMLRPSCSARSTEAASRRRNGAWRAEMLASYSRDQNMADRLGIRYLADGMTPTQLPTSSD